MPPWAAVAKAPDKRAVDANYAFDPVRGGRQSQPINFNPFGLTGWYFIPHRQYQDIDVEELDVSQFSADQLLSILPDLNPDWGMAVWNYLRMAGTKVEFECLTIDGKEYPVGQKELDDIIPGLNPQWGGIEAIIRQLLLTAYLEGACSVDVAPTKSLKDVQDIYVVDPNSIWFQRDKDQNLVPFQRQAIWGNLAAAYPYRLMNEETFLFVPVDPFVDDPYGRAPAGPALQVVFGLVAILRDLQRVIHMQGYPRLDMELVYALLEPTMPAAVLEDEQRKLQWMQSRMNEVIGAYNSIAPEDAFVHWDFVKVNRATDAGKQMFDVEKIIHVFRQQLIVALKSLPIFHAEHVGSTETYGTVEFEIYAQSIETLRDYAAQILVRALTVALHLRGIQATVRHEWPPIRTGKRWEDARSEWYEVENAVNKRDQGWMTQDDASIEVTGSKAVAPPPPAYSGPLKPPTGQPAPEPPGMELAKDPFAATAVKPTGEALVKKGMETPEPEPLLQSGRGMAYAYTAAALQAEAARMAAMYAGDGRNGRH